MKQSTETVTDLIAQAAQTAYLNSDFNSSVAYQPQFLSNDYSNGRKVLSAIEAELYRCTSFTFSVAFITMGGITPLLQVFKVLEDRGVPGRILTTDYLAFSEPAALEKLDSLSNIEVRMFETRATTHHVGFHTKGYFFEYDDGSCKAIVGSSNMTASALTENKEWNLKIVSTPHGKVVEDLLEEQETLWAQATPIASIVDAYRALYNEKREMIRAERVVTFDQVKLEPNNMQRRFVAGLDQAIARGKQRALLISSTGTGKTYAAAFAMRHLKPQRVLFLAHREQILRQSMESFARVLGSEKTYGLLSGSSHDTDCDYVFATMQTTSKDDTMAAFDPAVFDVVIIDEVHRAGAQSYRKIMDYFTPRLFLGMTASPDRTDGFDIYGLFDNEIVYEIRLQQALEEGILCPFHYFGITEASINGRTLDDNSDFKDLAYVEREQLASHLMEWAEYYGHSGSRVKGLVFCRTTYEARELARLFAVQGGYRTLALSGADSQEVRIEAVDRLSMNEGDDGFESRLDYIFTVDIFNEGVDIPPVNQVLMVRPTESPIVFIQQLGRGLRKVHGSENKEYVVVLDFIGNYSNNYMIPLALSGDRSYNKDTIRKFVMEGARVIPGASSVHFDEISRKRIFESIDNSVVTLRLLKEKYSNLKHKLGRIPDLVDFLDHADIDPLLLMQKKGSYQGFLVACDNEYMVDYSDDELSALSYLSTFLANGMRPHELLLLEEVLLEGESDRQTLEDDLVSYYSIELDERTYASTKRILAKDFATSQNDEKRYGGFDLLLFDPNGAVSMTPDLELLVRREEFRHAVLDLIDFGLHRYAQRYTNAEDNLCLYEKYSRKDVCRLLCWEHDDSSTMYGYRVKHGTCPIFVTYNKQDDISSSTRYEDAFIDQRLFSWMTRSRLTLDSDEVRKIRQADRLGIGIYLFVKKHDSEGSDFYYMGKVHPRSAHQKTICNDKGKALDIVNFVFELEHSVRDDIYDYFTD